MMDSKNIVFNPEKTRTFHNTRKSLTPIFINIKAKGCTVENSALKRFGLDLSYYI